MLFPKNAIIKVKTVKIKISTKTIAISRNQVGTVVHYTRFSKRNFKIRNSWFATEMRSKSLTCFRFKQMLHHLLEMT